MDAVDYFGRTLVQAVRDQVISEWEYDFNAIQKKPKTPRAKDMVEYLRPFTKPFTNEQIDAFNKISRMIVDDTLTHFLYMLETHEDISLSVHFKGELIERLQEGYYGLHLALVEWINEYSSKTKWINSKS